MLPGATSHPVERPAATTQLKHNQIIAIPKVPTNRIMCRCGIAAVLKSQYPRTEVCPARY